MDFGGLWRTVADFCKQIKSATVWRSPLAADFHVYRGRLWRIPPDSGTLWQAVVDSGGVRKIWNLTMSIIGSNMGCIKNWWTISKAYWNLASEFLVRPKLKIAREI